MQAIVTKYIGPTNTKPARIKATCDAGSITVSYPYGLSQFQVNRFAAQALCDKMGWQGQMIEGELPNNAGSVFVFVPV